MEYISKELAIWLNEQGYSPDCKPAFYYKLLTHGQWHKGSSLTLNSDGTIEGQNKPELEAFLMPGHMVTEDDLACGDTVPAYSWFDILVTLAEDFADKEMVACHSEALLSMLRHGDLAEAEASVKEGFLIAKNPNL